MPNATLWQNIGYYYAVNMLEIRAYPSPIENARFSTIKIGLTQLGENLFYDEDANKWTFTTQIYPYTFQFDAQSGCSISAPYDPQDIDYIHYSPYGVWEIDIAPNQLNITAITKIDLLFTRTLIQTLLTKSLCGVIIPIQNIFSLFPLLGKFKLVYKLFLVISVLFIKVKYNKEY